jgi:hypothetical protein
MITTDLRAQPVKRGLVRIGTARGALVSAGVCATGWAAAAGRVTLGAGAGVEAANDGPVISMVAPMIAATAVENIALLDIWPPGATTNGIGGLADPPRWPTSPPPDVRSSGGVVFIASDFANDDNVGREPISREFVGRIGGVRPAAWWPPVAG